MPPLLAIGTQPLVLDHVAASVDTGADVGKDGAVVTFLGLVRNHNLGRSVRYLEYEAYEPLALKSFERIASEIRERWPSARLALH
ncbi:MAG TPA: molybdenum cofactor biosynthesis protein MoaE, partial [Vicinamibacterales bacterium]|nr:molybdenum cofactor biosynthesis protein MoaE [Vicinamibacterales bacterium]